MDLHQFVKREFRPYRDQWLTINIVVVREHFVPTGHLYIMKIFFLQTFRPYRDHWLSINVVVVREHFVPTGHLYIIKIFFYKHSVPTGTMFKQLTMSR